MLTKPSISFCAAFSNMTSNYEFWKTRRRSRFIWVTLFESLYLAYYVLFDRALSSWDDTIPKKCYITTTCNVASTTCHPRSDLIYLRVTFIWAVISITACIDWISTLMKQQNSVKPIIIGLLQYPIHLYMLITMRGMNADLLTGYSENTWGFGQVVALVLLSPTLLEILRGIKGGC